MVYKYEYELVAAVFLLFITICYYRKNWLKLRANMAFSVVLYTSVIIIMIDMAVYWLEQQVLIASIAAKSFCGILTSLGVLLIMVVLFIYMLALTERLNFIYERLFVELLSPAFILVILLFTSPWSHFIFYFNASGKMHLGQGFILAVLIVLGYWCGFIGLVLKSPHIISRKKAAGIVILAFLALAVLFLQYKVLDRKYLLFYYPLAVLIMFCYVFFQNMDRFSDRTTGGFSRAGFRKVVRERCLYQEDFVCISINIQNYQNIINICDEEGIYEVMGQIGSMLRKLGGRHNQFHIHSSEFIVMQKNQEEAVKLFQAVLDRLPATMRINNRTIVINYGFYLLSMEEAFYNQGDFYRILSSMKKQLRAQPDKRKLMRYEGQVKETVDMELLIGRKLKKILAERKNDTRFLPIVNAQGRMTNLETLLFMTKDNGEVIPSESIWDVAKDMGCIKEIGSIAFESVMQLVSKEHIFDLGIEKIHINVMPLHFCSEAIIREYKEIAEKYRIPMERICMEITEDMSVSPEILYKYACQLKETGACLLLDQYGVNVCNLQSVMNMPFDLVKLNHSLISIYCTGESNILEYQVKMLRNAGFAICMDGIDSQGKKEKVSVFHPDYLQGYLYSRPVSSGKLVSYLQTRPVIDSDG